MPIAIRTRAFESRGLASSALLVFTVLAAACTGAILDPEQTGADKPGAPSPGAETQGAIAEGGLRRLTAAEYDQTVSDLLGDPETDSALLLPEDVRTPFDNDYTMQAASKALIEGAEMLATDVAARLIADPVRRANVVGCKPNGPSDSECFRSFVSTFGRRALRRPLKSAEVDAFAKLGQFGVERGDFWIGVETAMRAFLQHPEFLYRSEIGAPVTGQPGLFKLTSWEMASRLSYFLWGSAPSDALLDRAAADELSTSEGVRKVTSEMLSDDRARRRIVRFHAMWLGFETLPHPPELAAAMQLETSHAIESVVFDEKRPWQDLLRLDSTFADDTLAKHYGLTPPGSTTPVWVSYGSSGRRGILSHGSFLANGAKAEDTSPTLRGRAVRTRLFCQKIPEPPANVNTEVPEPTAEAKCKKDLFAMHKSGACAACHDQMDPIGFGLENYDQLGRYRTVEPTAPECVIDGVGEIVDVGTFRGPAELADLLLETRDIDRCVVEQLYRFAVGRTDLSDPDLKQVLFLQNRMGEGNFRFDELLSEIVSADAFRYRREQ